MPITPERIVIKHSFESGAVPDINDLVAGELALNATDNVFFYRGPNGQLISKDLDFQSSIVNYVNDTFSSSMLQSAEVNNDGDLIFTYLDNSVSNLGNVIGPRGEGIAINGVVDYAIYLPLPVADGGGIGDVGILPESLNKTGTIFVVRLGIDEDNLFGTPPYDPGDPVLYMYNAAEPDPALRWFSTGVLQGPQGEIGPTGEVTATNVNAVLDDLGLGLNDVVSVIGLQLSDTSSVTLDSGVIGLNGYGDLVVHNGYDQGDSLPSLKTSYNENLSKGLLLFGSSILSGTTALTFKIGEFYIPSQWLSVVNSSFSVTGQVTLEYDGGTQRPSGGVFLLFGFGDFDDTDYNTMATFVNLGVLDYAADPTLRKTVKIIDIPFQVSSVTSEQVQVAVGGVSARRAFEMNYKSAAPGGALDTITNAEVLASWKQGEDFYGDQAYYLQPGLPSKLKFYVYPEAGGAPVNMSLNLQVDLQISKRDILV